MKTLLAVDPSSGGTGGLGWAFFRGGKLERSGVFFANSKDKVHLRLVTLATQLEQFHGVDFLAVESLPRRVHHYVMWSVGVVIAAVAPKELKEIPIKTWKEVAREQGDNYKKGDEADALCIGFAALRATGRLAGPSRKRAAASRHRAKAASRTRISDHKGDRGVGRVSRSSAGRARGTGGRRR